MSTSTRTTPSSDSMGDNAADSDSDTSLDDTPTDYYQPISAVDDEDSDQDNSDEDHVPAPDFQNTNGFVCRAENGISSLHLNGEVEQRSEEEEEEERMRRSSDSAMLRAFREDERRRNAPLPTENAARVMEAMRGISFGGVAPDWADQVPEVRWINQLRRMRQPQRATEDAAG